MVEIISKPDTTAKLRILSADAQYDLACACNSGKDEHRRRDNHGGWIYPVTLPNGGKSVLFKTLMSNVCTNDCKYCPLREKMDVRRCTLTPEETANTFLDYYNRRDVFGLFLSSSVFGTADNTMDRLNAAAQILRRKHRFKGYIHLKIIPGSSPAAIEQALSLASTVSLNIETPGQKYMKTLSDKKQYIKDIIEPIKLIGRLTARGERYQGVKQTTQFIVGASTETDSEIIEYMSGLYDRIKMHRIYFSAYQHRLGDDLLLAKPQQSLSPSDVLTREHRLYQADFLFRKYRFNNSDFVFDKAGNLSLETDPKEAWAKNHPEFFPVNVNRADKFQLLRVPGLGPVTVDRILKQRKEASFKRLEDISRINARILKAQKFIIFS